MQPLFHGHEVVSPILSDNSKDISLFHALLDTMQELGFYYDEELENCSGQINIGVESFNSPQAFLLFYETFCNAEELLFHIANKPGQLTRQRIATNSRFKPISGKIGTQIVSEDITLSEALTMFNASCSDSIRGLEHKKNTVCLRDKDRLEIRIFNGSTEYKVWKENILLIGKMVEFSNRCADILKQKKEVTPEDEMLLWNREELRDEKKTLEDKLYIFLEMIFLDDNNLKQIYIERFYELERKIKETGTDKYNSYGIFKPVEFLGKFESKIDSPDNFAKSDPEDEGR